MHLAMHHHDDDAGHGQPSWGRGLAVVFLIAIAALLLARTIFFVDETEYVYVTQFGQPLALHTQAGPRVKWPYQGVLRFDRRLHLFEPPPREILTEDKENLNFEWFVCWRIPGRDYVVEQAAAQGKELSEVQVQSEVEKFVEEFMKSVGTIEAAERRLEERIQAGIAAQIGRTKLSQLVTLDSSNLTLQDLGVKVARDVRSNAAEQFGIEVVDVRLKRFGYPEAVKPAVYAEIRSERERVAVQYRAEGASEKAKIESLADLHRDQLLAQAQREATTIRGEGEAKAIEIFNAAHGKNPQFYEFLRTLETYRSILDAQTTVVLSADSPLLRLLTQGLPAAPQEHPKTGP